MRRAREAARSARCAVNAPDETLAGAEWGRVFGDLWPSDGEVKNAARAEAATVSPGQTRITSGGGVLGGSGPPHPNALDQVPRTVVVGSRWIPPDAQPQRPLGQCRRMSELFPLFRHQLHRGGGVEWRGQLRPTAESPAYDVRIVHSPAGVPRVYVDRPRLLRDAPHVYRDCSLCLYWPAEWCWRATESLAETIVPWAAMWLYYYEVWLVTGEWLGPSSPHGLRPSE
jgi:hypothetical protein